MKSYLSQSLEWKLITTSPMKRLQPLRNKSAEETFLKFSALLDLPFAPLVTCDQCIENEVEEGCSKTGGLQPQLLQSCQLLKSLPLNFP